MKHCILLVCAGIAAASGHGPNQDDDGSHRDDTHSLYEVPPGYAAQQPSSSLVPAWTQGHADDDDDDDYEHPASPVYSKPPVSACSPTTLYETKTVPTTIHYENTIQTTLSITGPSGPTVYVTSLTSKPAVTVYITTTLVETNVYPVPTTVTTTEVTTTSQCAFCKIDIYATALRFPTTYTTRTVYATTYDVYKTVHTALNRTEYSTSTLFAPTSCIQTPVTTWEAFGVVLTSGTTYLAYTNISRGYLEPRPTVYGCGELVSVPLELGPAGTQFNELILPTTAIPTTVVPAPSQLVAFLDSLPTVAAQLPPGVPAKSCDDPNVVDVMTPEPQVTGEVVSTVGAATVRSRLALKV